MNKEAKHGRWILRGECKTKVRGVTGEWEGAIKDISFYGVGIIFNGFTPVGIRRGKMVEVEIPYLEPMADQLKKKPIQVMVCWCKNNRMGVKFEMLPATDPELFNNLGLLVKKEGAFKIKPMSPQ